MRRLSSSMTGLVWFLWTWGAIRQCGLRDPFLVNSHSLDWWVGDCGIDSAFGKQFWAQFRRYLVASATTSPERSIFVGSACLNCLWRVYSGCDDGYIGVEWQLCFLSLFSYITATQQGILELAVYDTVACLASVAGADVRSKIVGPDRGFNNSKLKDLLPVGQLMSESSLCVSAWSKRALVCWSSIT